MNIAHDHIVASAQASLLATSRLKTDLKTRDFISVADDPRPGTAGEGPTPTEYLLMALASCTAITLREYADRKYDYAGDITVAVAYHEPQREGAERYLQRTVTLSEAVPEPDFQHMIEIAERTPVTLLVAFAWSVRTDFINDASSPIGRRVATPPPYQA